jgi:hypothetical protein
LVINFFVEKVKLPPIISKNCSNKKNNENKDFWSSGETVYYSA